MPVTGKYDPNTGMIRVNYQDLFGANAPTTEMRGRVTQLEKTPYTFFEGRGLRRQPYKKLTVEQLFYLKNSMPAAVACIDYIKNRAITFPWKIVRVDNKGKHNNFSEKRAEKVRKIIQGPNQFGWSYRMTLNAVLDDLLTYDVGIIEKEVYPITGGVKQIGVIDARKIRPNPANYQGDLMTDAYFEMDQMYYEKIVNAYKKNEILWMNLNPQAGSFYGFSPLEVLDTLILMDIYARKHNIKLVHPNSERGGGIVYLGNVGPQPRKEFEERYEQIRQFDPGRPMITSGGDIAPTFLDLRAKADFDWSGLSAWLAEMTASVFQLNLRDIGIAAKGKGSAGTAAIEQEISDRSGIYPRMMMLEEQLTTGIVQPAGGDDLKLQFTLKRQESIEVLTRSASIALKSGILTENECRELLDETYEPYPSDIGDTPMVWSGNNVFSLKQIVKMSKNPEQGVLAMGGKQPMPQGGQQPQPGQDSRNFHRTTQASNARGTSEGWS